MTDPSQETPEVRAWLDEVEERIEQEAERRLVDLVTYGSAELCTTSRETYGRTKGNP
jgi:hypothetical protein